VSTTSRNWRDAANFIAAGEKNHLAAPCAPPSRGGPVRLRKRLFERRGQFLERSHAGFLADSKVVLDQVLHILFHRQSKVARTTLDGRHFSRGQFNPWKNCCRRHNQLRIFNLISTVPLPERKYYTTHPWVILPPGFQAVSTTLTVI
jgi:hypothetical protein